MYTKSPEKLTNKINRITRYFEGTDLSNSLLFRLISNLQTSGQILVTSKRYDLMAKELYYDASYYWVLQMYSGIREEDLIIGSYLNYPDLNDVIDLILNLDEQN